MWQSKQRIKLTDLNFLVDDFAIFVTIFLEEITSPDIVVESLNKV